MQEWQEPDLPISQLQHLKRRAAKRAAEGEVSEDSEQELTSLIWDGVPPPMDTSQPLNLLVSRRQHSVKASGGSSTISLKWPG